MLLRWALGAAGEAAEAELLARELVGMWSLTRHYLEIAHRPHWLLIDVGLRESLVSLLGGAKASLWRDALERVVADDPVGAAEVYRQMGAGTYEAQARLRAAKQLVAAGRRADADEQLQRALAFYRSVGATRYIREGEALLAAAS
jgi:hypothetical protein